MEELARERRAIAEALDELQIDGWRFESDAGARPESIERTYLHELASSDLYIAVFWKGYGERTIHEYEHARKLGKSRLIYARHTAADEERDPRLTAFLQQIGDIESGVTIRYFETPEQLTGFVREDVARWQSSVIRRAASPGSSPFQATPLSPTYVARTAVQGMLEKELLAVEEQGHLRITRAVIHGQGGLGKSTIARAFSWSDAVRTHFTDAVLWATPDDPDLRAVLSGWGRTLRDPSITPSGYPDTATAVAQLRAVLRDKACLIVVDDVRNAAIVEELFLLGGPDCLLLLTSRLRSVADRLHAHVIDLPVMTEAESLDLFERWTGPIHGEDLGTASRLMQEVGHLPLALELIGAQVRRLKSWSEVQRRWNVFRLDALRRGRGAHGKEDSILDSIELSVGALGEQERADYLRLAVIPKKAGITPSAAAALWGRNEEDAYDLLLDLSDQALMTHARSDGRTYFTIHDVLYEFLRSRSTAEALVEEHRKLVDGYRRAPRWEQIPDDGYLYDHLSHHLAAAGLHEELHELFDDDRWMLARVAQSGYTYDRYLADVAVARQTLLDSRDGPVPLARALRYAFLPATLGVVATSYSPSLITAAVDAGVWSPERALSFISLRFDAPDPDDAIPGALDAIAGVLELQRLDDAQRRAFQQEALGWIETMEPETGLVPPGSEGAAQRIEALDRLLSFLAWSTNANHNRLTYWTNPLPDVLARIARVLPPQDADKALAVGGAVALGDWPADVRFAVLRALFSGPYRDAVQPILACPDENVRHRALLVIAGDLGDEARRQAASELRAGRVIGHHDARYLGLLASLDHEVTPEERADAERLAVQAIRAHDLGARPNLCLLVAPWASAALQDELAAIVDELPPTSWGLETLAILAQYLQGGPAERVMRQTLEMVLASLAGGGMSAFEHHALSRLAPKLSIGQQREVLAVLASRPVEWQIVHGLARVAHVLDEELIGPALRTARSLTRGHLRAAALSSFIGRFTGEQRRSLAEEALQTVLATDAWWHNPHLLERLAHELPEQRTILLQHALRAAASTGEAAHVTAALCRLVPFLSGAHRERICDTALREVVRYEAGVSQPLPLTHAPLSWSRPEALATLVPYLTADQHAGALEAIQDIQEEHERARALIALAPRMTDERRATLLDDATAWTQDWVRGEALRELAPYFPDSQLEEAWRAAGRLDDAQRRLRARIALARRLIGSGRRAPLRELLEEVQASAPGWWMDEALPIAAMLPDDERQQFHRTLLERGLTASPVKQELLQGCAADLPAEWLHDAMRQVMQIDNAYTRSYSAAAILPHLPSSERASWVDQLLASAKDDERFVTTSHLAHCMSPAQIAERFRAACAEPSVERQGERLFPLIPYLSEEQRRSARDLFATDPESTESIRGRIALFRGGMNDREMHDSIRGSLARWLQQNDRELILAACADTAAWGPPLLSPDELTQTADVIEQLTYEWSWM